MTQEQGRLRLDFMSATKDAGALNRQLLDKDDEVRRLRVACAVYELLAAREFSR